ncbi:hypothetical protein RHMOL_Rhmol10G0108300 [Rhododendron molle]|uniref:Uncharacterized protein n=1 Tax=Rhododendron molle TaxID=49168 RepID=A0ACC0M260_RHOML|nr:hypothetical protein RHMOL_Rhmol10G0108300 [Rhododendron molle]
MDTLLIRPETVTSQPIQFYECNSGPSDLFLPFNLSQIGNQAMKLHLGNPSEQHPNSEGWIIFVALLASQIDSKVNTR